MVEGLVVVGLMIQAVQIPALLTLVEEIPEGVVIRKLKLWIKKLSCPHTSTELLSWDLKNEVSKRRCHNCNKIIKRDLDTSWNPDIEF